MVLHGAVRTALQSEIKMDIEVERLEPLFATERRNMKRSCERHAQTSGTPSKTLPLTKENAFWASTPAPLRQKRRW